MREQIRSNTRENAAGFDGSGHGPAFDGWGAHARYFLARYPTDTRDFIAERLAVYGIRSLLSSHRQEDLTLDALISATDAADRDVLSLMREHAKGRQERRGERVATTASASAAAQRSRFASPGQQPQPRASGGALPAPREALRERGLVGNMNARLQAKGAAAAAGLRKRRHEVTARPDVLTRYPFVDDLGATQGGGVGAALHRATPTTPVQYLAKREIKRLAHEAFRELKASALGIRLSDLPCALQFLFFGDSASLLTAKGGGGGGCGEGSAGDDGVRSGGMRAKRRSAKDVHLVMALARECLPPTLAHAARDTSTLSSASSTQAGGVEAGWRRDVQNMFVSERRWMRVVAHVVRRLWGMDGMPERLAAAHSRRQSTPAAATAAASPFGMDFQQPVWRPVGGGGGGGGKGGGAKGGPGVGGAGAGGARFPGDDEDYDYHIESITGSSFLGGLTADARSDTIGWGSAAAATAGGVTMDDIDDGDLGAGEDGALRAWEEEGEDWVGAGRSLSWAAPGQEGEEEGGEDAARGVNSTRPYDAPGRGSGPARSHHVDRRGAQHKQRQYGGSGAGGENWKVGTRPAGMWEVTPPAHLTALRRGRRQGGGVRDGAGGGGGRGPAYLRGVQSRIGPQLHAHRERLRKIADARRSAVKDVVARRRLDEIDSGGSGGGGGGGGSSVRGEGASRRDSAAAGLGSRSRGHTPGEHALDIAEAFLESSLMTRLAAGGDWFGSEDGEPASGDFSLVWEADEAVRVPPPAGRRRPRAGGSSNGHPAARGYGRDRYGGGGGGDGGGGMMRGDDVTRRRKAYTGWLGDFGPAHTHTVREIAAEEDDPDDDDDGVGGGSGGSGGSGGDDDGRRGHGSAGLDDEVEVERKAEQESVRSKRGNRRPEQSVALGNDGGDGALGGRGGGGGGGGGGGSVLSEQGEEEDATSPEDLGGGCSGGDAEAVAEPGMMAAERGGNPGIAAAAAAETDDADADADAVAPLDGGFDAYLQLASDGGPFLGVKGGRAGGGLAEGYGGDDGVNSSGDGILGEGIGGSGFGVRVGGGSGGENPGSHSGETTPRWWTEHRPGTEEEDEVVGSSPA